MVLLLSEYLLEIPVVMWVAHWLWDNDPNPLVTAEKCLLELPFLSLPCNSRSSARIAGVVIILGACLNRAPTMLNVVRSKSTVGLSKWSLYSDVVLNGDASFYGLLLGHPFTAFGESFALFAQSIMLVGLLWLYGEPPISRREIMLCTAAAAVYLFVVLVALPPSLYYLLMASGYPLLLIARGSQIAEGFRLQHTGTVAFLSVGGNLLGSMIRILTTLKEMGWEFSFLLFFGTSTALNATIVFQYFYYRKNTERHFQSIKAT